MMDEYRIVIRVKNNLLQELMKSKGIESQSALARAIGSNPITVGAVANLKIGAFNADGSPSKITKQLCDFFCCLPEDIYPRHVLHVGIPKNVIERVVSGEEVSRYLQQQESDPAFLIEETISPDFMGEMMSLLTDRQRRIVEMYFVEEKTYKEIGEEFNVTGSRIMEIIKKSLSKLRSTLVFEDGNADATDTTAAGLETRFAEALKNRKEKNDLAKSRKASIEKKSDEEMRWQRKIIS